MKIVIANNFYYLRGGSERVLFEEKRILEENGHQVFVFSQAHPNNEHSEYANYFPPYTTNYENMPLLKRVLSSINIVYSRKVGRAFLRFLEESKPDLVHAHIIYGGLTTSILDAAAGKDVPVVMTLHDYKLICPSYIMLNRGKICEDCKGRRFYYCLLNRCHKESLQSSFVYCLESYLNKWLLKYDRIRYLICPSHFSLKKHAENGIPEEKLVYIPNFVNFVDYEANYQKGDYVLFVGRLSKEKGIPTLLEAAKRLHMPIKIVGDGPMGVELESYVTQNTIKNIVFEGYKSGEELRKLYQDAAFLVMPSECYENAPMTILEAFAYGKPVIGSRIGGIPEVIESNQTGMLFEAGNTDELRECIETLWSNNSLILEMGHAARSKVETEFSPQVHYKKLVKIYEDALS